MESYFASGERADPERLAEAVAFAAENPIINSLLLTVGGLVAVLNEQRQILAVNEVFLATLGIPAADAAIGLRQGEVLSCMHAAEAPSGCGTGQACASCGAAISIVTSLAGDEPVERECCITSTAGFKRDDLLLSVRATTIELDNQRVVLLFLRDITDEQKQAVMANAFRHDLNNLLAGLLGAATLLRMDATPETQELTETIGRQAAMLRQELQIQELLTTGADSDEDRLIPSLVSTPIGDVFTDLKETFAHHPSAFGRSLSLLPPDGKLVLRSDRALLARVLTNAVKNALEASADGDLVRVWAAATDDQQVDLFVWNAQYIPPKIAPRIYQRNFSTKGSRGRGLGTYSMKLLTERYLEGELNFVTDPADGTTFRVRLPLAW